MTSVGHSLTGISIGVLCMPGGRSPRFNAVFLASFAVLANLPDLPVPYWGHSRYDISHSIFTNSAFILLAVGGMAFLPKTRRFVGGWSVVLCGAAAWLSHLLLDTFYNHGNGLGMFWPVSNAHLALPIPWFATATMWPKLTVHNLRVASIEILFYGALLALCIVIRILVERRVARV